MDKFEFAKSRLNELKKADRLRQPVCIDSAQGTTVQIDGRQKTVFCSNNYLSLANHPRIIKAVTEAMTKYGHGAAASRLLSGTMAPHMKLEQSLARLLQKEAALVFTSGWTANEALIRTIARKGDLLLLDKFAHASIIDAAAGTPAHFRTYRRENLNRLDKFLRSPNFQRRFIVTESIFSMDGDAADLRALVQIKKKHDAILIVDEAHAFGCLGKTGAGLAEQLGILNEIDVVVVTMSKAVAASGGVVAGRKLLIDLLINQARSFIYTTAPTVANCAAALAAVEIIEHQPSRREKLTQNARYLRKRLKALGINIGKTESHIIPVIIGSDSDALLVSARLYEKGFFVPAIRPPTVPPGTARLRISLQSGHSKEQINSFCTALQELAEQGLLPTSNA